MMEREIKFRAWSKRQKKMYYPEKPLALFPSGVISLGHGAFVSDLFKEGWELMQYTGLKDINNKEVYDGDVLEHAKMFKSMKLRSVISWDDTKAKFRAKNSDMNIIISHWAVIGNIYENPELLN